MIQICFQNSSLLDQIITDVTERLYKLYVPQIRFTLNGSLFTLLQIGCVFFSDFNKEEKIVEILMNVSNKT